MFYDPDFIQSIGDGASELSVQSRPLELLASSYDTGYCHNYNSLLLLD